MVLPISHSFGDRPDGLSRGLRHATPRLEHNRPEAVAGLRAAMLCLLASALLMVVGLRGITAARGCLGAMAWAERIDDCEIESTPARSSPP